MGPNVQLERIGQRDRLAIVEVKEKLRRKTNVFLLSQSSSRSGDLHRFGHARSSEKSYSLPLELSQRYESRTRIQFESGSTHGFHLRLFDLRRLHDGTVRLAGMGGATREVRDRSEYRFSSRIHLGTIARQTSRRRINLVGRIEYSRKFETRRRRSINP